MFNTQLDVFIVGNVGIPAWDRTWEEALDAEMEAMASVSQEAGVVRCALEPAVVCTGLRRCHHSERLCAACPRLRRGFPCGRRARVKEAEGPFVGAGSCVPSCWPERRAARWAQGAPSTWRPVPCPAAPSSSSVEGHCQQCGCHFRTFAMSQLSPWSPLPHATHSPRSALAVESHVRHKESEGRGLPHVRWEEGAGGARSEEEEGARHDHQAEEGQESAFPSHLDQQREHHRGAHGGGSACGIAGLAPHHRARPRIGAVTAPPSLVQALGSLPAARPPPPALAGWHYLTSGPPLAPSSAGPQSPLSPVLSPSPFLLLTLVFSLVLVVGVGCCLYFRVR